MEENCLLELLGKKKDGAYYVTLSSVDFMKLDLWFEYFNSTSTFLDNETREILRLEFVPTRDPKKIAIVDSFFLDELKNEDLCYKNLKRFSQPTAEVACLVFEFFYNYFHEEKDYKYSPVFLLRKSGSSINAYMRLGKNKLSAFFFVDKR